MFLGEILRKLIYTLSLACLILWPIFTQAKIIGAPPYTSIEIPASVTSSHFDMVIDKENTLYISSIDGVKIFNGSQWQNLEIMEGAFIRKLFLSNDRVYVGGTQTIGYIKKDRFGQYKFFNITPANNTFESIWTITECNNNIYFRSIHKLFEYNSIKNTVQFWKFKAKLGTMFCHNNQINIQDRDEGFKKLVSGQWIISEIQVPENPFIFDLPLIANDTYFVLSGRDEWQLIKNNTIIPLNFDKQLPHLNNYVSIAPLSNGKLVLGSNNGLLTFVDTNTQMAESFQLANEWIAKIIVTSNNEIVVLTEFEVFYLQWPSPLRVQSKESGLSSDLLHVNQWNNKTYVLSSGGVFVEDPEQILYQHKLYRRLDWTHKEAWWLLPIDDNMALLAESHHLLMVDEEETTHAISDVIYPRELIQSQSSPNLIFVITEFDLRTFIRSGDGSWKSQKIFDERPLSILEISANELLLSTYENGIVKLKFDELGKKISASEINNKLGISTEDANGISFTKFNDGSIYAYKGSKIYKIKEGKLIRDSLNGLDKLLADESLNGLKQNTLGDVYGNTYTKFFFQNKQNIWNKILVSPHIKGTIKGFFLINDEVKISAYGTLVNYLNNTISDTVEEKHQLNFTSIEYSQDETQELLPLDVKKPYSLNQDSGNLSFTFTLSDIKNHKETQYRYRVIGFNDKWSNYNNTTKVNLSQLTAGDYSFEVQAKNKLNQVFSIDPFLIKVNPPWYLTTMAKILWVVLIILVLLILLYLLLKWRERIHEIQKKELKNIINHKTQELKQANKKLQKMAHHDGLTGLSNRLYLDEFIKSIVKANVNSISILMLDMDHFKKYNDNHGHLAGDELLKKLAVVLTHEIEEDDHSVVARYGGEEFVIILLNESLEFAIEKAEKIRKSIENNRKKISASIGISHSTKKTDLKSIDGIYQLIDLADQHLYQAKDLGRNKICTTLLK